jgi:integrase
MHYVIEQRNTRAGATRYRAKVRLKGARPVSMTFARKTDARKWAEATAAAIREGRYTKTAEAKRRTLADAIERYIDTVLPRKPKSAPFQKRQLEWWRKELGHLFLADVTPANVVAARDRLMATTDDRGRRRGGATSNRYLAVLSHLLTVAANEWEWLDDSPLRKIRRLRETKGRKRFLSQAELNTLFSACRGSSCRALYPIVVLAVATGMRRGEILGLRRDQVDLVRQTITLSDTKNGESRELPLDGHARNVIEQWCEAITSPHALLFPSKTGTTPVELRKPWYAALEQAGLLDVCFHDLRRTAATNLHATGASTLEIGKVLGHKTEAMVRRYTQHVDSSLRGRVRAMNDAIFSGEDSARTHH